jgi:hypothetical protein
MGGGRTQLTQKLRSLPSDEKLNLSKGNRSARPNVLHRLFVEIAGDVVILPSPMPLERPCGW